MRRKQNRMMQTICGLCLMVCLLLSGCSSKDEMADAKQKLIGITMNHTEEWEVGGTAIKTQLDELGYEVDLHYTDGNVASQKESIRSFIDKEASCIVVGAVDDTALVEVLEEAKNNGIPVIAYDTLIKDTKAVNYYLAFDDKGAGMEMARKVETQLKLATAAAEGHKYKIGVVKGDPKSKNDEIVYDGVMQVLEPYIDANVITCDEEKTDGCDAIITCKYEKNHALLAKKAVLMIQNVADGYEPEVNDVENYYNGKYIVPAYVCASGV